METEKMRGKLIRCPLCKEKLEIRLDEKHKKPYVICNPCGVQMFIRRDSGIKILNEKLDDGFFGNIFD